MNNVKEKYKGIKLENIIYSNVLKDNQRQVLQLRLACNLSMKATGDRLNLSASRIRQIEAKAIISLEKK